MTLTDYDALTDSEKLSLLEAVESAYCGDGSSVLSRQTSERIAATDDVDLAL